MSKPKVQQIAGLDVVDWLYFNQTLVRAVLNRDELAWFIKIVERVKTAVTASGTTGMDAEIMKHYVLCFLEILASDESADAAVAEIHQHGKKFFCALLVVIREKASNNSLTEALQIASALLDEVLSAPAVVRVRLAERCLAVEYETSAHEGFLWLVKAEAIPCAQFRGADVRPHPSHETIVVRIGLLCEFESVRFHFREVQKAKFFLGNKFRLIASNLSDESDKKLVLEAGELWEEHHFRNVNKRFLGFSVDRHWDKVYVVDFLKQLHLNWNLQRLWTGTMASWVSNLGALSIVILKSNGDPRTIYNETNKDTDTLSNEAEKTMRRYGMTIRARSLYMRYSEAATVMFPRLKAYCEAIKAGPGVFLAEEKDPFYWALLVTPWDASDASRVRSVEPKIGVPQEQ